MWIVSTFIAALFFAASSMVNKIAMREEMAVEKLLPGTFLAGFALLALKQGRLMPPVSRPLLAGGLAMSFFSMINCVAILLAIRSGPVGKVAAVAGSHSVITPLAAWLLLAEKLNLWQWAAVGLATGGMVLVQMQLEDETASPAAGPWFVLALLGAASASSETLVLDRAVVLQNDGMAGLVWSYFFSFVFTSLWFLYQRQCPRLRPFCLGAADGAISAAGMIFFAQALAGGPAGLVAALSTTAVSMRAIGGRLFFAERLSLRNWIGIILSVFAFGLVSFFQSC